MKLKDLPWGCFFFDCGLKYYKSEITQDLGKTHLCHPVVSSRYGEVILEKQNTWISGDERILPAQVKHDEES